mmetsp:Transcript_28413/g.43719  ORF Transcript_28413/g.43719 Transcript_28413/m.43719 type:complete len:157 (-) Transcript_28413:385-855(-)|eukprot:CAMPEP_0118711892 /NCGR_PEP_ID=MMETSP0800-20121206/24414_1 /TAXON_ID=210618 ORGANISM="Striatella unipunctata, Strain CCMP2910" /NCGR_SAMPLE_ID=MMETSP0800 /ASSEMBLY_ACC=CAM_ASM_000638 /LENGTH=156 /DNA_ID=CAMNT_0006616685 /DNA_START=46 /DNA_END=516 /DNA_ORIENTATION=+
MASLFLTSSTLKDELFCAKEERNFFQSKYLEQVSEIQALKDELAKARGEIRRLRQHLMTKERSPSVVEEPVTEVTEEDNGNQADVEEDDETRSQQDIRNNAAQLLQWANYRLTTSASTVRKATDSTDEDDDETTARDTDDDDDDDYCSDEEDDLIN